MSSAVYLDQIKQLVELQKVDDLIFAVRQEMERAPKDLEALQARFDSLDGKRNAILEKIDHLQEQQKRLTVEIDDDTCKIRKSKNKLMQVGNTKEYQAMIREMDTMERVNRSREEEKLLLMEELKFQNDSLAELDRDYTSISAELEVKRDGLDEKLREAEEKLKSLNHQRNQVSRNIPQPIFMRYEFIRSRLEHPVIVSVGNGICSGCHIAIPPQSYIELQRGQQILSCPNCQRLVFWEDHFQGPSTSPQAPASFSGDDTAKDSEE